MAETLACVSAVRRRVFLKVSIPTNSFWQNTLNNFFMESTQLLFLNLTYGHKKEMKIGMVKLPNRKLYVLYCPPSTVTKKSPSLEADSCSAGQ
jgi:hypothetical protein